MFGMDVLTQPQIHPIILDFPNEGAQSVDFGSADRRKFGALALNFLGGGGTYEHPYRR